MSKYLFIGAHPDDPDVAFAGGAMLLARAGHTVKFISLTNGDRGHQTMQPEELAVRRAGEARKAAALCGIAEYDILPYHDTQLMPALEARETVIRLIRTFAPDVVITHRACDYHADHRAAGQLVTDAAFLVGVPHCCPDTPRLARTPVFACACDFFRTPAPFVPDAVVDISGVIRDKADVLLCHESQFLEWLPWVDLDMPDFDASKWSVEQRRAHVMKHWLEPRNGRMARDFRTMSERFYGYAPAYVEAFSVSEYGRQISAADFQRLMTGR